MSMSNRMSTMSFPGGALRGELSSLVRLAVLDLFAQLEEPITHLEEMNPSEEIWHASITLIGFRGTQVTGTLIVSAATGLLAATNPAETAEDDALADWSCELANMTLGAFKARLAGRGVGLDIGLPTLIGVSGLRVGTTSPHPIGHRFLAGRWPLMVALDIATTPGLRLVPRVDDPGDERMTVLFF